ncbi:MAG: hypothetical protein P9D89_10880 [Candidatus Contendobacter sp.]|nr:hypothetical protein [Candidatus Contendobacter sp.]
MIIDTDAPEVKSLIERRKAREAEEKRIADQRNQEKILQEIKEKRVTDEKELERIKICGSNGGKINIGMGKKEFRACKNRSPIKINYTTTASGKKEQWVYKNPDEYYYFINGILTAIQD